MGYAPVSSMASLTPGVLSKLLEHASTGVKVAGEHRSILLQVIEIVPLLAAANDDPLQCSRFLLKVSDSVHSTYVAIPDEETDLIFSDKIQLGQLVHVERLDSCTSSSPFPVLRGIKPLPRRRPCIGSPRDIRVSEVLPLPTSARVAQRRLSLGGTGRVDMVEFKRRTSHDPLRRSWERSPGGGGGGGGAAKRNVTAKSASSPLDSKRKDASRPSVSPSACSERKASSKSDSFLEHQSVTSPMEIKSNHVSVQVTKSSSKGSKLIKEEINPCHLVKLQLNPKDWDQSISWDALPSNLHDLGKDALHHRNAAFFSAVHALQEASAAERVIHSLSTFTELCLAAKQESPWILVERFLDLYQGMQQAATVTDALLKMRFSEVKANLLSSLETPKVFSDKRTMAIEWVQAALETDLSPISLFNKKDKDGSQCKDHYVILETSPDPTEAKVKNHSQNKQSPQKQVGLPVSIATKRNSPSRRVVIPTKKKADDERVEQLMTSGLKETALLAKSLLSVSREWFLKYLESALEDGFGGNEGEKDSEIVGFVGQLKRVNQWLDDIVGEMFEIDDSIENLRKKLYRFLLDHVHFHTIATRETKS